MRPMLSCLKNFSSPACLAHVVQVTQSSSASHRQVNGVQQERGGVEKHRFWVDVGWQRRGRGCLRISGLGVALLAALLGQQHRVDVGQHTAGGDGDATQQLA